MGVSVGGGVCVSMGVGVGVEEDPYLMSDNSLGLYFVLNKTLGLGVGIGVGVAWVWVGMGGRGRT